MWVLSDGNVKIVVNVGFKYIGVSENSPPLPCA